MILSYYLLDPTGNCTVLAESPVPAAQAPIAAARLMEAEPSAEQVGFLSENGLRLDMAGGEFCGNASMCAGVLQCQAAGGEVTLQVSGAKTPVTVRVAPPQAGWYRCTVQMPPPDRFAVCALTYAGRAYRLPAVSFGGLTHLIMTAPMPRAEAEEAIRPWCAQLGADALGLMLYDAASQKLDPLVWVPGAGTLVWEHSCASGTTAVGLWEARNRACPVTLTLQEPAGSLTVDADPNGEARLTGSVRIVRRAELRL